MDRTGGFAASVAIRQQTMQELVRILYNAGLFDPTLSASIPTISTSMFMALPQLRYDPSNGQRLEIDVFAWGPMTLTPPGGTAESRRVKFRAKILVPHTVSIDASGLRIGLDSSGAAIEDYEIDPYSGGLWSSTTVNYILSEDFRSLLTLGLSLKLGQIGMMFPPFDTRFLGALTADPAISATHAIVDEAIVIGIDSGPTGSVDSLSNSTGGNDIGLWINPRAVPRAYPDVRTTVEEKVVEADATLDDFQMTVEEGWFRITGEASGTGGRVLFETHAIPQLIRPGIHDEWDEEYGEHFEYTTPDLEELWFKPTDITVNIIRDWWVPLVEIIGGIITFGIGALVVEALADMVRGNITGGILSNTPKRADRNQVLHIQGVSRPRTNLRLEEFECHAEGVFVGLLIQPMFWAPTLDGIRQLGADEALIYRPVFEIDLPPDTLENDPELKIRWVVRRTDTNEILILEDDLASGRLRLEFGADRVPFLQIAQLAIEVRVYRILGAGVDEIFTRQMYMNVTDYVDRSHPYVHWTHEVDVPIVESDSNGVHHELGREIVVRHSALHRTAIPGRCRMLRHNSRARLTGSASTFPLEYLDALPFPVADLVANRATVCDYCFFGGPDKTVPLIP